jgi:hypothetical protein
MRADAPILRFTEVALVRAATFNRRDSNPAPPFSIGLNTIVLGTERDSNSATDYCASTYEIRESEYCYEEGSSRGASL